MARYVHPLPGVKRGRIDEGVDFAPRRGQKIRAIGNGVVDFVGYYRGFGIYMAYHLTDGPLKGQEIYVSEGLVLKVREGQKLRAGSTVAVATGASTGIEMGFAQTSGTYLPLANASYNEGDVTGDGKNFASLLDKLAGKRAPAQETAAPPPVAAETPQQGITPDLTQAELPGPPSPDETIAPILNPGTVGADDLNPKRLAQTWQQLASQPLASQETQYLAQSASMTGG